MICYSQLVRTRNSLNISRNRFRRAARQLPRKRRHCQSVENLLGILPLLESDQDIDFPNFRIRSESESAPLSILLDKPIASSTASSSSRLDFSASRDHDQHGDYEKLDFNDAEDEWEDMEIYISEDDCADLEDILFKIKRFFPGGANSKHMPKFAGAYGPYFPSCGKAALSLYLLVHRPSRRAYNSLLRFLKHMTFEFRTYQLRINKQRICFVVYPRSQSTKALLSLIILHRMLRLQQPHQHICIHSRIFCIALYLHHPYVMRCTSGLE